MRVFSSMRCEDIDLTKTQAAGARYLKEFLQFAERGQLTGATVDAGAKTESPFEYGLFQELSRRGLRLVPQVGVAGYRIDIGVLDDDIEGRFICGVECDGAAYHAAESARDRDRLRQQVLEGLGWTLHRVWSTDWFKDRGGTVQRLVDKIEQTRRLARARAAGQEIPAEPVQRPSAASASEPESESLEVPAATGTERDGHTDELPAVAEYRLARLGNRNGGAGVLEASLGSLIAAIGEVARAEAPVHDDDVMARLASAYGDQRVGPRIAHQLESALATAERRGVIVRRGGFVYLPSGEVQVRSRAGTEIPAERIAPEEYREIVLLVLRANGARPRDALIAAVRTVLGFNRTGSKLEERIGQAIDSLVHAGDVGEGSTGLAAIG
jgi:very-short-patch-repair endonuclease